MEQLIGVIFIVYISLFALATLKTFLEFQMSSYRLASNHTFIQTFFNKGNWGEYKIYTELEKVKGKKRILTNLYLPKKDGSTTEVDLVMITKFGFFVIESKNYGGWIFGNEANRNWTQSFPNKKKFKFFNPIWQNKGHIRALQETLAITDPTWMHSLIVFSNRCELKKITLTSPTVHVIKKQKIKRVLKKITAKTKPVLTPEEVEQYAQALEPYTHADEKTKELHIETIKAKLSR
ncbi:nuclease-related domain-containing protein [Carnobacterium sp. TMP28]|uniref:nuclease-related domain-containing protein n=1 Tax=Carnobacterium sp. TMP28 TaxID=3397060 RepID=UPI0039DFB8D6